MYGAPRRGTKSSDDSMVSFSAGEEELEPTSTANHSSNIQSLVMQTDASGRFVRNANPDGDIPPPVPEDDENSKTPGTTCCGMLTRYICCLTLDQFEKKKEPPPPPLLPAQSPQSKGKPCLVLDLDETLVHSAFQEIPEADFRINIGMDGNNFEIYVVKRPGLDEFLTEVAKYYEIVLFTASVSRYALKVTEIIDEKQAIEIQLFREHCTFYQGNFVKDLGRLNRNLGQCIIVDNSPFCYQFHTECAIGVSSFTTDKSDRELYYLKEFLINIKDSKDMRKKLKTYESFIRAKYKQERYDA